MLATTRTWIAVLTIASAVTGAGVEVSAQGAGPPGGGADRADAAPAAPPRLELVGVVIRGDVRRAVVRDPALPEGRAQWVEVGGRLGAYTVVAIERDRVMLEDNGDALAVRLAGSPPSQPTPAPATAPPATAATTPADPAPGTPARRPSPVAEFLAWRTGASVEDIEARIRAGRSWLAVAQEYGLEPSETLREYRAWRTRR